MTGLGAIFCYDFYVAILDVVVSSFNMASCGSKRRCFQNYNVRDVLDQLENDADSSVDSSALLIVQHSIVCYFTVRCCKLWVYYKLI